MKKFLLLAFVFLALPALAQVRAFIIDQSTTLEESMRLLFLVRNLKSQGFSFTASTTFPTEPWEGEPFLFVIYIPAQGPYLWFCSPAPETMLPEPLREAAKGLKSALAQAFSGLREVRGPAEDLYPWLLSLYFARLGFFGEIRP